MIKVENLELYSTAEKHCQLYLEGKIDKKMLLFLLDKIGLPKNEQKILFKNLGIKK